MTAIIMQRRRPLVVPRSKAKGEKVLKSCVRCRANKTRCDAVATSPFPCTHCAKKKTPCQLDVTKAPKREYDLVEKFVAEVKTLHRSLDSMVSQKARIVDSLIRRSKLALPQSPSPCVTDEIQTVLSDPTAQAEEAIYIDPIPTLSLADSFTIHTNQKLNPISISTERAKFLFGVFEQEFSVYLPVLSPSFFQKSLHDIHKESSLLFWAIIATSLLGQNSPDEYFVLANHLQNLVVVECWFSTPRSLCSLIALLILTTWPLPDNKASQIQDSIAVKYISLMKSLALQYGLHKLNFIEEFSKKTNMEIDDEAEVNHILGERIYKYVNINSNYWLVHLGLSTSSYNGFHQDYIINRAANIDLYHKDDFSQQDNMVNSLLKVSIIQSKMNENMNDLVENPNNISKLVNLNMFEQILNSFNSETSPLIKNDLISLSVGFSKLQLYIYYLSKSDIGINDYKVVIGRTIETSKSILKLFEVHFSESVNFFSIPIHYRFCIELISLTLLQIHSSALLESVEQYQEVKELFLRSYLILTNKGKSEWKSMNNKILTIIHKFDACDKVKILSWKSKEKSFFIIGKMSNYLVSSLHYESLWQVYQTERNNFSSKCDDVDWSFFGLHKGYPRHEAVINYLSSTKSIFGKGFVLIR